MDEANKQDYQNKKCGCGSGCCAWGNGWHGGHHMGFHILRWVLGIFIIFFAFWIGMKIGEFKGEFEYGGGFGQMRHHQVMIQYGGYGMMNPDTSGNAVYVPAAPATTSKTVKTQ